MDTIKPKSLSYPLKKKSSLIGRNEIKWGLLFISPWIIGFLIFYLIPMIASFGFSLFRYNLVVPEKTKFIGLANWKRLIFEDKNIIESVLRIFLFGLVSVPIGFATALFLAILLNSKKLIGQKLFRTLFYLPTMVPLVATVLIWKGILNEHTGWINLIIENAFHIKAIGAEGIRWLNSSKLIYITYTMMGLWGVGNYMLIFLAGLQKVPTELYESSEIDGAGWWRRFFHITIPHISPIIFFNLIIAVIGLMQYFLVPFVMNGGDGSPDGTTNFIMGYFYKQAFTFFNMGYGATIAWVIFAISLGLTFLLFKSSKSWVYYAGEK